jgi:FtsP/CotA-like multicopper oxidase with cupredoxin domain
MKRLRVFTLVALTALVAAASGACARNVTLNEDAGQTYAVNVINRMSHAMTIAYDDGQTTRPLGTVAANRSERFVIAAVSGSTITLVATDPADTQTVRRTVALSPGATVDVVIE